MNKEGAGIIKQLIERRIRFYSDMATFLRKADLTEEKAAVNAKKMVAIARQMKLDYPQIADAEDRIYRLIAAATMVRIDYDPHQIQVLEKSRESVAKVADRIVTMLLKESNPSIEEKSEESE